MIETKSAAGRDAGGASYTLVAHYKTYVLISPYSTSKPLITLIGEDG